MSPSPLFRVHGSLARHLRQACAARPQLLDSLCVVGNGPPVEPDTHRREAIGSCTIGREVDTLHMHGRRHCGVGRATCLGHLYN